MLRKTIGRWIVLILVSALGLVVGIHSWSVRIDQRMLQAENALERIQGVVKWSPDSEPVGLL